MKNGSAYNDLFYWSIHEVLPQGIVSIVSAITAFQVSGFRSEGGPYGPNAPSPLGRLC
jgi:hypothetical protein